jgi:hypothetical protein
MLQMSALPQATSNFADLRVAMKRIDRYSLRSDYL